LGRTADGECLAAAICGTVRAMELRADARVPFERTLVFRTYRDHLRDLLPYLPDVRGIEVRERRDDGLRTQVLNVWRGGGEIPAAARSVLSETMLSWNDHAAWDETDWSCAWRIETHAFTEAVRCSGSNRFVADGENRARIEIRGTLEIDARKLPGVPRLLAGTVAKVIEGMLLARVGPNLVAVSEGVSTYLRAKADG